MGAIIERKKEMAAAEFIKTMGTLDVLDHVLYVIRQVDVIEAFTYML